MNEKRATGTGYRTDIQYFDWYTAQYYLVRDSVVYVFHAHGDIEK